MDPHRYMGAMGVIFSTPSCLSRTAIFNILILISLPKTAFNDELWQCNIHYLYRTLSTIIT
jgi:hypothetical protein